MAKLSKSTRTVIIAAAVLLVLGAAALVLLLTSPDKEEDTGSSATSSSEMISTAVDITDKSGTEVLSAKITNEAGSFTFTRDKRVVSTTDEEGNVTSKDEYYWTSKQMAGLTPNSSTVKSLMNSLAGLTASDTVEENAEDLEKYGLSSPVSTAEISFEDGTSQTVHFGIRNPADTSSVYCRVGDGNTVYAISYYSVTSVFSPIMDFVNLTFTPLYDGEVPQELDYLIIERKDLDEPVEITYMYDVAAEAEDEDAIITTFNSHRFTSPLVAEVDATKGQELCYGLYGLAASECISVAYNEELLALTGLDDPFCKVTFKYGGKRYVLLLGDKIITETETDNEDTPILTTVTGYYGMIEGNSGVYAFSPDSTPWYSFAMQDYISRRPVSPYIYTVDSVVITTPDNKYELKVVGDADNNSFFCGEQELDGAKFKQLYQHLITAVGDELFLTQGEYEPWVKVEFNYRDEYTQYYGTEQDVVELFHSDAEDRKSIVRVNGTTLFKVRQVYTERLISNVEALLNGGDIQLNW